MRAPEQPSGCPSAIAPPCHVCDRLTQLKLAQDRQRLHRERLVDFDQVDVCHRKSGPLQRLARRVDRPHPHHARVDAGRSRGNPARQRADPQRVRPRTRHQRQRARAVVQAAGIARRNRSIAAKGGPQFAQCLHAGRQLVAVVRFRVAGMLVNVKNQRIAPPLRDLHRHDLPPEASLADRVNRPAAGSATRNGPAPPG